MAIATIVFRHGNNPESQIVCESEHMEECERQVRSLSSLITKMGGEIVQTIINKINGKDM